MTQKTDATIRVFPRYRPHLQPLFEHLLPEFDWKPDYSFLRHPDKIYDQS